MTRFTILGSGTSTGVPSVACDCDTCLSTDPRDKRLRTSLLVETETTTVVVDTSTDFRQQMLRYNVMHIDGVVYTHSHFDHIGGFDDIRPYQFRSGLPLPIYATMATQKVLRTTFPYAFGLVEPTGASIPEVTMFTIAQAPFTIGDLDVLPIPLLHGGMPVLGFRFGNVAYCTDTNSIPASSMELLGGLDTLVIDGLRWQGHPTHFTVSEAIQVADVLRPRRTLLTHIAHQVRHAEASQALPDGVELAYDGLVFSS